MANVNNKTQILIHCNVPAQISISWENRKWVSSYFLRLFVIVGVSLLLWCCGLLFYLVLEATGVDCPVCMLLLLCVLFLFVCVLRCGCFVVGLLFLVMGSPSGFACLCFGSLWRTLAFVLLFNTMKQLKKQSFFSIFFFYF